MLPECAFSPSSGHHIELNNMTVCHLCIYSDYTVWAVFLSKYVRGGRVVRWYWVNFQRRGILLIWTIVGQGPTVLAVGAGEGCLDIFFSHLSFLFSFSLSLGHSPI